MNAHLSNILLHFISSIRTFSFFKNIRLDIDFHQGNYMFKFVVTNSDTFTQPYECGEWDRKIKS